MPEGNWSYWAVIAGRGFGKTRTGAEAVRAEALRDPNARIALIAPTAADIRDVMIEGMSGILSISPPWFMPTYEPSKRHRLTWPNGAIAYGYSAEEPERLRGPQHSFGWLDELATWKYLQDTWDMYMFGLRLGQNPRTIVTTTPRPVKVLKDLLADPATVTSRGSTYDNASNLAAKFLEEIRKKYEGTRLGRQELNAEILDDVPGALWPRATLDGCRIAEAPDLQRIVVAVDPSGTKGNDDNDSVGIVVAGKGVDGRAYVLADRTCKLSPAGWGRRAVEAYHQFEANLVVGEVNYGGAMVEYVIKTADHAVPFKMVTASRGKSVRAEPIAALYEQGRVSHVGNFSELEDQMASMTPDGYEGDGSPDRADALVWAMTELMLDARPRIYDNL